MSRKKMEIQVNVKLANKPSQQAIENFNWIIDRHIEKLVLESFSALENEDDNDLNNFLLMDKKPDSI